jgi:hypothetical protein
MAAHNVSSDSYASSGKRRTVLICSHVGGQLVSLSVTTTTTKQTNIELKYKTKKKDCARTRATKSKFDGNVDSELSGDRIRRRRKGVGSRFGPRELGKVIDYLNETHLLIIRDASERRARLE